MLAKKIANGTGCWNVLLNNWMGVGAGVCWNIVYFSGGRGAGREPLECELKQNKNSFCGIYS